MTQFWNVIIRQNVKKLCSSLSAGDMANYYRSVMTEQDSWSTDYTDYHIDIIKFVNDKVNISAGVTYNINIKMRKTRQGQ